MISVRFVASAQGGLFLRPVEHRPPFKDHMRTGLQPVKGKAFDSGVVMLRLQRTA